MLATIIIAAFAATAAGVFGFRRLAAGGRLLDLPNDRSSHTTPTVRGGGIVLVIVCLSLYVVSAVFLSISLSWGYVIGALLIAAVSWLDDLYTLSAAVRLPFHLVSALVLVAFAGPARFLYLPLWGHIEFGWTGYVLSLLWVIWVVNAYNFMDGIDGIAGIQAAAAGIGWAMLGSITGSPVATVLGAAIAGSACGFLVHNWSPAKVFMGDVGSAFLGFTFAALPLLAGREGDGVGKFELAGIVFLWPFIFDTIFTVLTRAYRGERIWKAHRQHLYQRAVINGAAHSTISLFYGAVAAVCTGILIASAFSAPIFEALLAVFLLISAAALFVAPRIKRI